LLQVVLGVHMPGAAGVQVVHMPGVVVAAAVGAVRTPGVRVVVVGCGIIIQGRM